MTKIVSRRIEYRPPQKINRVLNLGEFYEKRNQILIVRNVGGLGDIFMHRMIFEDIKILMPDCEIHFACPAMYHEAIRDHPFIDKILDSATVDKTEYIISYNTTSACGRYEMRVAPFSDLHRSDIWSRHCGLSLNRHNMHIILSDGERRRGADLINAKRNRTGPAVVVCPVSAMSTKNLLPHQLSGLVEGLYERGCYVVGLHAAPIQTLLDMGVPCLHDLSIRDWMAVLHEGDYVVSVDTAAFHCAGGMRRPLTGIFTWADGAVYGKYYEFELVQKHRSLDPTWTCGPCYNWCNCPKTRELLKPCLTELTPETIMAGVDKMLARW